MSNAQEHIIEYTQADTGLYLRDKRGNDVFLGGTARRPMNLCFDASFEDDDYFGAGWVVEGCQLIDITLFAYTPMSAGGNPEVEKILRCRTLSDLEPFFSDEDIAKVERRAIEMAQDYICGKEECDRDHTIDLKIREREEGAI